MFGGTIAAVGCIALLVVSALSRKEFESRLVQSKKEAILEVVKLPGASKATSEHGKTQSDLSEAEKDLVGTKTENSKADTSKIVPKAESSKTDTLKTEIAKVETPVKEAPKKEIPKKEIPSRETYKSEIANSESAKAKPITPNPTYSEAAPKSLSAASEPTRSPETSPEIVFDPRYAIPKKGKELDAATARMRLEFKKELGKKELTLEASKALAKTLRQRGLEFNDDPAFRFAYLDEAQRQAVRGRDLKL